ncbi:MAG: hypothetical protein JXB85_00240 [Anaerolineales bacterium]|nr:hypothetical protein [Anaerolineales bacterium]
MRSLSASDLLAIWERGAGRSPVVQALIILGIAFPEASPGRLADLTVAQRDAALFQLRRWTFGPQFVGLAACPACAERLELAFDDGDLPLPDPAHTDLPSFETGDRADSSLQVDSYQVTFRLPASTDLLAIDRDTQPGAARGDLLQACILSAQRGRKAVPAGDLPAVVQEAVITRMDQLAPLANLTLAATCPACGHAWDVVFDIVSYFWSEITVWAMRIMHEVHALASAYGWREADILAMSAWRRQRYLELMGA